AVYGFYNMLLKIIKDKKPDYLFIAFDYPGPNFRHKIYDEYKIQREKMPESLQAQMRIIREIAAAGNIRVIEESGYEADDIIAAAAYEAAGAGNKVVILSSDKDMIQLVNKDISILKFSKDGEILLTPETVREKYGITPGHIVDVLALMGDASDNIPGVKGIGEKTAYKLVQNYGTVEEIIKKAGSLKPEKVNKLVLAGLNDIKLSMELAVLRVDPSLIKKTGFVLDSCGLERINRAALDAEFIRYNFKSLVSDSAKVRKAAKPRGKALPLTSFEGFGKKLESSGEAVILFCGNERSPELILVSAGREMYYMYGRDFKGLTEDFRGRRILTNSAKTVFSMLGRGAGEVIDVMLQAYLLNPEKNYNDISHIFTEYGGGMYLSY
ncbi:MAG TPA: 5'-3' exonuclease H3TH domain-containing protein, partial [Candidatus Goldiibacteriota bacterium]|nr:5'-3' exonuclease H3TH domain-containing protein [Candidatus Goldiibacteriota bacterium]